MKVVDMYDELAECVECRDATEALFWDSRCENCTTVISEFSAGEE